MDTTLNIPPRYLKFFVKNHNESRYMLLQGGRRSGKTYSTFQWLYFLCCGAEKLNVLVAAATAAQLQATVQDFQDCLGMTVTGSKVYGDHCILPNGSIWQFKNYDEYTKCVGQKCDYLFLNEAVNLDEQSFGTLVQGVRKAIILNYNPTRKCWVDKYLKEDKSNLLVTTWQDNPYLTQEQKDEFEAIKTRALSTTATIFDKYAYTVFYRGDFSDLGGQVFKALYSCTDEFYDSLHVQESRGMDFGFVDGADNTVLMGVKIYEDCLYIKEYINSKHLANNKDLAFRLADLGFTCYDPIFADFAGCGAERIKKLCSAGDYTWTEPEICRGFDIRNANKTRVIDGLQKMLQFTKIVITESSEAARAEFERYELGPEGNEVSKHQNCIDAARYAVTSYYLL